MLTGEACLSALDLGTLEHVRSCVFLNKTEFVEFGLPAAWLRGGTAHVAIALDVSSRTMTLPLDGLAAPPLELFVDAREHAPPLAIGVSTDGESFKGHPVARVRIDGHVGWILGRGAIERDSAAMTALPLCLVLCHWDEDLSWLRHQPGCGICKGRRYPAVVYEKQPRFRGVADSHSTPRNTANEASAYLQFVVDRYEALPMRMVFLHSHRYAFRPASGNPDRHGKRRYHQEDVLSLLHDLDPVADGYCNLNSAAWGTHEDPKRALLYETHREWVERHLGPLPPLLLDRCCAQFFVHQNRVLSRPKSFYAEALRHALSDAEEGNTEQNRQLGLVFEWLWPFIFGEPPVAAELKNLVADIEQTDLVYMRQRPKCVAPTAS